MRPSAAAALAAGLLAALPVAWLAPGPAAAQVAVNPGALDALPQHTPRSETPRPAQRPTPPGQTQSGQTPSAQTPSAQTPAPPPRPAPPSPQHARPAAPPAPAQPAVRPTPPAVPPAPPPSALMPPPVAVPTARPVPPAPVPVIPDAPGEASTIPGGTRVTFGPDRSDLNPDTEAALRALARSVKADETTSVNVLAYAAGGPDDPSTPRRLSLARALAARAVLIQEGLVSTRIYVRALGAAGGDGPADRVDLTVAGAQPRPASATTGPAASGQAGQAPSGAATAGPATAGPASPGPTASGQTVSRPAAPGPTAR